MGTTLDAYVVRTGITSSSASKVRVRTSTEMTIPLPRYASRRVAPLMSRSQAYYWTHAWQAAEQESLAARQAGESQVFDSAEDVIRYLLNEEED